MRTRPIRWMKTLPSEPLHFLIRWNLMPKKTLPRRHESRETYFTFVVKTIKKFDVNEEAWPNADLAVRSSYEGALIDGLPADKSEGRRRGRDHADERSAAALLGQRGRRTSRKIHLAHRLGTTDERKRSEIAMCPTRLRGKGER